jgi:hypothetical protein
MPPANLFGDIAKLLNSAFLRCQSVAVALELEEAAIKERRTAPLPGKISHPKPS